MAVSDYKGVFIFAQQVDNKITGVSYELIGKGKALAADLGTEVTAVLLGYQVGDLTKKLAKYGADRVIVVDDPALECRRGDSCHRPRVRRQHHGNDLVP